jgi:hypothetical protein
VGVQAQLLDNAENNTKKETYSNIASKHMYITVTEGTMIQSTSEYVQDEVDNSERFDDEANDDKVS